MYTREKLKALTKLGVSAAKIGEPLHRSTISKWLTGTGGLSLDSEQMIEKALNKFKEEVNKIL